MSTSPTPVVTCTIYYGEEFLVIRRHDKAKKFGGTWGFPGGKVETGETAIGALKREIKEETNLDIKDKFLFVNSYYYGDSVGFHFTAFATNQKVTSEPGVEYQWLKSLKELQKLPRIPGIDFHIKQTESLLKQSNAILSLKKFDYLPDKYIN